MPEASVNIENLNEILTWTFCWLILISLNAYRLLYKIANNAKNKRITVEDVNYVLGNNALFSAGFILFAPWSALVVIVVALAIGTASTVILLKMAYPNGGEIK